MTAAARFHLTPRILLALAGTWLVWSTTYLAIKFALLSFPPFFQMGTRFLVAGALMVGWCLWRGDALPSVREWRHATLSGGLMLGGGMGGTAWAEQSVGSGLVVAFIAVVPMMITALNLLWGVRPGRLEAAGMCLGLVGVLLLTQGASFDASPAGLVAISVACLTWSVGSVLTQRRWPLAPGAMGYGSQMLCGGLLLCLLSPVSMEQVAWPPEPSAVLAWLYLVVAGSLIAFNAYMVLLHEAPAGLASSYTFVNPVLAMVLGVAVAGEAVTPWEWGATGVILTGVVLLLSAHRASAPK